MEAPQLPLSAIRRMRLELDLIAREHETRSGTAPRDDLVQRAAAALGDARSLRIGEFVIAAATRMALLLNDTGRPHEARRLLADTEPQRYGLVDHPLGIALRTQHARAVAALARREPDPIRARALWQEAECRASALIGVVEGLRARVSVPDLFSAYTRFSIDTYAIAIEARLALGDLAGALACIELVKCRSIHRLHGQPPSAADESGLRTEFRRLSRAIDDAAKGGQSIPDEFLARRRALWDLLAIDRFAERDGTFAGFDLGAFRDALPAETAAISWFWIDRERLATAAVHAGGLTLDVQRISDGLRQEIDDRADAILTFAPGDSTMKTRLPAKLADVLFPPAVRDCIAEVRRLVLSPHRSLHALPLHALPWSDGRPLIRRYAVSYAPNLTILLRPEPPRSRGEVLFVGVPRREDGLTGAPLPGADLERADLEAIHGGRGLTAWSGADATESRLRALDGRRELSRFAALHFACHGVSIDSDNPMESRLLLYDSDLDGLDVTQWQLDADLVMLSACSAGQRPVSGRGLKELPGDELFGLQAAFFAAGARRVLATLWPVRDDVAPAISAAFHRAWRTQPADLSLQSAICRYLDARGRLAERTPHTWACFFLTTTRMPEPLSGKELPHGAA